MSESPDDPLSRDAIAALVDDIANAPTHPKLTAYFARHDAPPPRVRWNPTEQDLPAGPLRFLLAYWQGHMVGDQLPRTAVVEPFALKPALGYVMLLDVLDEGWDYRYRVYGSAIAERLGRDYTGRRTSDIARLSFTGAFYIAAYRAVIARRAPLFTVSPSPRYVAAVDWSRVTLPLVDGEGAITRLLVGNVPGDWRAASAPMPPRGD